MKSFSMSLSHVWTMMGSASMACILGLILIFTQYLGLGQYSTSNGQLLEITVSRGETITINLQIGSTINGLWASNKGLKLQLEGWKQPILIVPPKGESWADLILTHSGYEEKSIAVSATFALPAALSGPEEQDLRGQIIGDVLYPSPNPTDDTFANKDIPIAIPVHLHITPESIRQKESDKDVIWVLGILAEMLFAIPLLAFLLDPLLTFWFVTRRRNFSAILVDTEGKTNGYSPVTRSMLSGVGLVGLAGGFAYLMHQMGSLPSVTAIMTCLLLLGGTGVALLLKHIFPLKHRA